MSQDETAAMPAERAVQINSVLVAAWMIREGMQLARVPDVSGFSPQEAKQASEMMRDLHLGRTHNPDGSTTVSCFVEPMRVRSLYTWALAAWADGEGASDA